MIKRVERIDGPRWQVYGRAGGRKVYISTHDSLREARAAEEDHRTLQRKIAAGALPPDADARRTFGRAVTQWLDTLKASGSRSHDEYESRVENHMLTTFQDVAIVSIERAHVVRWRDATSERVSASTTNSLLGTLSSAFTFFVEQRWVETNPCQRVRMLEKPTKVFPWLQSTETVTRLLRECTPNIQALVAVLVGTGMRLDEALHLRWDDIDLEHRIITVHRGRKGTTKSGKMRRVPIFDSVLRVLQTMRLARGTNVLLWPGARPEKPLSQPSVRKPFKRAVEHAELPPSMRLHDLRHSFASLFLLDGGDIFKLSRILGHSSVTITERTYAHLSPDAFEADYKRVAFRMPQEPRVLAYPARLPEERLRERPTDVADVVDVHKTPEYHADSDISRTRTSRSRWPAACSSQLCCWLA